MKPHNTTRQRTAFFTVLVAATFIGNAPAHAAGFAVGEQGAQALGVGGAATARADIGEAGYYNPAAWGFDDSLSLSVGASAVMPSITHVQPDGGARTAATIGAQTPPYVHAGYRFGDFAAGVSFDVPFGAGLKWPQGWRGRFEVTAIDLRVYEVAASFVWRPIDKLAVAAGPRLERSVVQYDRHIDAVDSEAKVHLAGDATGLGGQLAVMYRPTRRLSLGLSYRSRVHLGFSGQADFQDVPIELQQQAHDQPVTTDITLPDRIAVGAAWRLPNATGSLDVTYWAWSTFQTFAIDFKDDATPDVSEPRNWSNSLTVRAGWEQRGLVDGLALRAGLAFDATPSPSSTLSPSLPDGHRLVPTIGAGYNVLDGMTVDVAYGHVFFLGAKATGEAFPGQYDASANLVAMGIRYAYGS